MVPLYWRSLNRERLFYYLKLKGMRILIKILNKQLQPIAILENAFGVGYTKRTNEVWSCQFSLPLDDPKNAECQALNYVELKDDLTDEYIGLFRIIPSNLRKNHSDNLITYECEHVFATLLDDVLFQDHYTSALSTADTIQYLLDRQAVKHWQLGNVNISRTFSYKWENENILSALFSIIKPFDVPVRWSFDTSVYPWKLNLETWPTQESCEIRYGKNLRGIERELDPTVVVNRWYALGYGEGVNQLNIKKVNPTGLPYVEDSASIAKYGLISDFFVDKSIEDASMLFSTVNALLNDTKEQKISYRVSAADLTSITQDDVDKMREGRQVRIIDPDLGTIKVPIVAEQKSDIIGLPYDLTLEISNKRDLFGGEIKAERSRKINELYAQGSLSIDSHDFSDNCDSTHPVVIRFFVPEDLVNVNTLDLTFETTKFRAYSKAAISRPRRPLKRLLQAVEVL